MGYNHLMKVFIFDPLWNDLADDKLLAKLSGAGISPIVITDIKPLTDTHELYEGEEDRILCLNPDYVNWKLASEDYENIPNLKAILVASTGHDYVERRVANERNIPICNIRNFSTEAVAEWAIMAMTNLARQTPKLIKDGFLLDFDKDFQKYRGVQLKGKTAAIIGLGHNGAAIAERCAGLGMNVVYWSKSPKTSPYTRVELDELFSSADVIFPAFAKNSESNGLLTPERLASVKNSAIIVDIIEVPQSKEIIEKVKSGDLFGYGYEAKPGTFNDHEGNIWAAPAYAWVTYESMYNSEDKLADNIIAAVNGEFPNRVN